MAPAVPRRYRREIYEHPDGGASGQIPAVGYFDTAKADAKDVDEKIMRYCKAMQQADDPSWARDAARVGYLNEIHGMQKS